MEPHGESRRWTGRRIATIAVLVGIVAVAGAILATVFDALNQEALRAGSADRIHTLTTLYVGEQFGTKRPWPPWRGKRFVLWLVASGKIDVRARGQRSLLFSPGDSKYDVDLVSPKDYQRITLDHLGTLPLDEIRRLTSWAGPTFAYAGQEGSGSPLLSDDDDGPLHNPDGLTIGFANGDVRFFSWADLAIPPPNRDDPAGLLGPTAKTPLLRGLTSSD